MVAVAAFAIGLGVGCGLTVTGSSESPDGGGGPLGDGGMDGWSSPIDPNTDGAPSGDAGDRSDGRAPRCRPQAANRGDGGCYFSVDAGTQAIVKARCLAAGGHLLVLEDLAEMDRFTPSIIDLWIGLESPVPSNNRNDFRWVKPNAPTPFDAGWHAIEPNALSGCVVINGPLWSDRSCLEEHIGLCEFDP